MFFKNLEMQQGNGIESIKSDLKMGFMTLPSYGIAISLFKKWYIRLQKQIQYM